MVTNLFPPVPINLMVFDQSLAINFFLIFSVNLGKNHIIVLYFHNRALTEETVIESNHFLSFNKYLTKIKQNIIHNDLFFRLKEGGFTQNSDSFRMKSR